MRHKIGVYLRVSTEEQALIQEGSLDSQRHRLNSFVEIKNAQEMGWGKISDYYVDEGLSAKDTRRPAFQRMMNDIRKRKINLILVTDLSRLSRSLMDFCVILNELKKHNAKFLSMKEQFDTSTAAGEMMVFNIMNLAQFERKQTSERVSQNFHSRALRGLRNGALPILGYDADPDNKSRLVLNDDEVKRVRQIFKVFLQEGSIAKTIRKLEELKIHPKSHSNRVYLHSSHGKWSRPGLLSLLRNPSYVGLKEVNKKYKTRDAGELKPWEMYQVVKASWSPIIDEMTFKRTQDLLDEVRFLERKRLENAQTRDFFLTGVIWCKECGRKLVGATATSGTGQSHRHYAHKLFPGEKLACVAKRHRAGELEEIIFEHLTQKLVTPGYLNDVWKIKESEIKSASVDLERERRRLDAELIQIDEDIKATIQMSRVMTAKSIAAQSVEEELEALGRRKLDLRSRSQALDNELLDFNDIEVPKMELDSVIDEIRRGFDKSPSAIKKRIIRRVFKSIVATRNDLEITYQTDSKNKEYGISSQIKRASGIKPGALDLWNGIRKNAGPIPFRKELVDSSSIEKIGAADEARTRDPQLGKLMLYQLSYCRLDEKLK